MPTDSPSLLLARPPRAVAGSVRVERVVEAPAVARGLDDVYRSYAVMVMRWAARLLGPDGDPDDVAHEVFLVVQRRLGEFRGEAKLETWLYEITTRVAQAHRRRARRWRWFKRDHANNDWLRGFGPGRGQAADPHELFERRSDTQTVYAVLGRLAESYRTALILYHLEGLSVPHIAEILRVSEGNVWTRLSRGRAKFLARWAVEAQQAPAPWRTRP